MPASGMYYEEKKESKEVEKNAIGGGTDILDGVN